MAANIIRFVLIMLPALLVGTMFGIWVGYNPSSLSASAYVEQQQNAIRSLNTLLPAMGAVCILLAAALTVLSKDDRPSRYLLFAAVGLMIVASLVTRFANSQSTQRLSPGARSHQRQTGRSCVTSGGIGIPCAASQVLLPWR